MATPLSSKILNDKIVSMRKDVKKAIVHQIHHLTATAKRLRNKKGTEKQIEKNVSKADNMVSEIQILKKMNLDDVTMFGLTNFEEKEMKQFLSKQIIRPETIAMVKLCLRNNLRNVIDQFIAEHSNEIDVLTKLLEERYSHKENNQKKKKKKNKKGLKNNPKDDTNISDESVPVLISASSSDSRHSPILGCSEKESSEEMEVDSDSLPQLIPIQKSNKKAIKVKNTNDLASKIISKKNVDKINKKANIQHEENESNIEKAENLEIEKKSERKNVDPFFMTRENTEYRTYCKIDPDTKAEKEQNSEEKPTTNTSFQKKKGNFAENKKNNTYNVKKQHQKMDNKRTITYLGGKEKKNFPPKEKWKQSKKEPPQDSQLSVKLHPSWEAKKKLSATSVPFQGKKITFED